MIYPVSAHLYCWINDASGNRMNICNRVEFCANNECVAALEAKWIDWHYLVYGASFLLLPARKQLVVDRFRVTYDQVMHCPEGPNPDGLGDPVKIELATYSWVSLLTHLVDNSDWRVDAIWTQLEPVRNLTAEWLAASMKTAASY